MNPQSQNLHVPYHPPFAIAAWALFVVSFFLPSYENALGLQCALLHQAFWEGALKGNITSIHYLLLTFPNLFMLASPWFILKMKGSPCRSRWLKRGSAVSLFLTATFMLELAAGNDVGSLRIGYFVWVFSFGLLAASLIRGTIGAVSTTKKEVPN